MIVDSIIKHIIQRVGKKFIEDWGEDFILESMNLIYHEINEELKALEKEHTLTFSDGAGGYYEYLPLPDDCIIPTRLTPHRAYRDRGVYDSTETGVWTIWNKNIYISYVDTDSVFYLGYFSTGLTLVNKETGDLVTGEINEPEWKPSFLHSFLIYATALDLMPDYPLRSQDEFKYGKLYKALQRQRTLKQVANPQTSGPDARQTNYLYEEADPYE